jgi:hypothetical protein
MSLSQTAEERLGWHAIDVTRFVGVIVWDP